MVALFMICQIPLHWAGLDVVKSDSPENILRRISKHDRGRHSEETLGLDIQIEESKLEKSRQPRAYRRLADTADAREEDSHVAPFNESLPISGQSQVIRPAQRLPRPQADKGAEN